MKMQKILRILSITSCVIFVTVIWNADAYDMSIGDIMEIDAPYIVGCNPQRSYYEELHRYIEEPTREAKCFRLCMLQKFNMLTEDAKVIEEKVLMKAGKLFENKENEINEIVQKCKTPPADLTDKCEITHVIFMCMLREARDQGFKIPEFKD